MQARALRNLLLMGQELPRSILGPISARTHLDPPDPFFLYGIRRGIAVPGIMIAAGVTDPTLTRYRKWSMIVLFADNTTSVDAITKENRGSSQQISQKFVETATTFPDENKE